MCLLICVRGEDGSMLLAANRDERYDRPAREPFLWPGRAGVFAGRDELAGGTWLAVSGRGVVAAVTNRPTRGGEDPARPTRGELPLLACRCASAADAKAALTAHLAATRYNGFNLFVADAEDAFVIQSPGGECEAQAVGPGAHVVGNAAWDDPADGRVGRAHAMLAESPVRMPPDGGLHEALERLMHICRDHLPLPEGGGLCLHGDAAGTVSSTILALGPDQRLMRYAHAPGPPCRTAYRDLAPPARDDVVQPRGQ